MASSKSEENNKINISTEEGQFVTFYIDGELYGVSVLSVHEIIGVSDITHVPNSPSFMKGVINMRGAVTPVVDMRLKFNFPEKEYDSLTVIIIVESKDKLVGMIVDSVSDVLSIPFDDIKKADSINANINSEYITSIAKVEENLVVVLNTDRIISIEKKEVKVKEEAAC